MKPTGLEFRLAEGAVVIGVTQSSRWEDAVYRAVEDAVSAGITPTLFIAAAREAWDYELSERAKHADSEFARMKP